MTTVPSQSITSGSTLSLQQNQSGLQSKVFFEYVGKTGMTVIGPVTGKRYRFVQPGSRVEVDLHDRRSIASVPQLRQLQPGDFPHPR